MAKINLADVAVGDKFAAIGYSEFGSRAVSAYEYTVIRKGKRDIVCHASGNGEVVVNAGDGKPRVFRFKAGDDAYSLDDETVRDARRNIADRNRRSRIGSFLYRLHTASYDEQFMVAVEAFEKRLRTEKKNGLG